MSPDRFFVIQLLFFVVWVASLLYLPAMRPLGTGVVTIASPSPRASLRPGLPGAQPGLPTTRPPLVQPSRPPATRPPVATPVAPPASPVEAVPVTPATPAAPADAVPVSPPTPVEAVPVTPATPVAPGLPGAPSVH